MIESEGRYGVKQKPSFVGSLDSQFEKCQVRSVGLLVFFAGFVMLVAINHPK
jgi:hypothetical protein